MLFQGCIDDTKGDETKTGPPPPMFSAERSAPRVAFNRGYAGIHLAVITIDYQEAPNSVLGPNRITFSGRTPGDEHARLSGGALKKHNETHVDAATFVKSINHVGGSNSDGERIYEAVKLTRKEAKEEYVKHFGKDSVPLFYIHGFNNEPGYVLRDVRNAQHKFDQSKTGIVPVLWPSYGSFITYRTDRNDNAPEAGLEMYMGYMADGTLDEFEKKNLMCHSMGNYVLRQAARHQTNCKFDNIFMVAADVRHNIFDHDYINRGGGEYKDGLNIFNLLKKSGNRPVGKIYILLNDDDYALEQSTYTGGNWVNRLGQVGAGTYDSWWPGWDDDRNLVHHEIRPYFENYDAGAQLGWSEFKSHSYQWMDFAINYYKSKI